MRSYLLRVQIFMKNFVKSHFKKDGVEMVYYFKGKGKVVLFLHGGGLGALSYNKLLDNLAKDYLVIAPDIPGFGDSYLSDKDWNLKKYSQFFSSFIKELGLKNIIVVGHSMGGGVACYLASSDEVKINRLIIINSVGFPLKISKLKFICSFVFKQIFNNLFVYKKLEVTLNEVKDVLINIFKRKSRLNILYKMIKSFLFEKKIFLENIKIPTFALWGNRDEIFSKRYADKFKSSIRIYKQKFVDGNHSWPLIFPDSLYNEVRNIIDEGDFLKDEEHFK